MSSDNSRSPSLILVSLGLLLVIGFASIPHMYSLLAADSNTDGSNGNCGTTNIIIGTRTFTKGTRCDDIIIACPVTTESTGCRSGDTLRGLERNDVLQGSMGDDALYGDEGNDELSANDGNDRLFGGPNNDVIMAGFGADFLVGDNGNDELYAGPDDDVLIGGPGTDYFDCGDGYDVIIDFDPRKGDTHADNCEVVLSDLGDKQILTQPGMVKSKLQALGVGSAKHPVELQDLGETINH
jgi:Ca2+-binding RTX toxin-like protein